MKDKALIIFLLLLVSCKPSLDYKTKGFDNVLSKFGTSIPQQAHLYIIIPFFSCPGCVQKSLIQLDHLLSEKDKSRVTIIYQKTHHKKTLIYLNKISNKAKLDFDCKHYLDNLPLNLANVTIIKTDNYSIVKIETTNVENIYKVINKKLILSIRN